ncbi:MAG TPA: amidase [Anaeromyxobacter sp.]|nr:amidase [Anaeromyxobacter sp.]
MRLPEYDQLDATGLAELVARREVSALELLEAALERADVRNPPLNAIVARYDDEARARARGPLPEGPFRGVPFLLKDLLTSWAGHPVTDGSRFLAGVVTPEDSGVVQRLKAAGVVLFGQTSTPEFGIKAVTEPVARGPCRNPWNLDRTPGGSSGGSAAAVAARIVPAAHGNDGGGSLRIPASCCGAFALKASRGRVSFGPAHGPLLSGQATEGVITISVRDSAALLDVLAGPYPGDPYAAPAPTRPFFSEVGVPPGRLRVAVTRRSLFARSTHPECAAAVERAARLLTDLGHSVEEAHPDVARDPLVHAYLVVVSAQVAADLSRAVAAQGRRPRAGDLELETILLATAGRRLSACDLVRAEAEMHRAARSLAAFHATYDVLVTPTLAQPPLKIGALTLRPSQRLALRAVAALPAQWLLEALFDALAPNAFDATGNTMLFNQTGQPAMSLPLHTSATGLPIGVQMVARFGEEATLFRLAAQLEAAQSWAGRFPPLVRGEGAPPSTGGSPQG